MQIFPIHPYFTELLPKRRYEKSNSKTYNSWYLLPLKKRKIRMYRKKGASQIVVFENSLNLGNQYLLP